MDVDESFRNEDETLKVKCYICKEKFKTRDIFMKHKKEKHLDNVQICDNFLKNNCHRNDGGCWYKHNTEEPKQANLNPPPEKKQGFRAARSDPFPPDHVSEMLEVLSSLCSKVETMQSRMKDMMK